VARGIASNDWIVADARWAATAAALARADSARSGSFSTTSRPHGTVPPPPAPGSLARPSGHTSSSKSTKGSVTSMDLLARPRANRPPSAR
jgi:hypothetical protein